MISDDIERFWKMARGSDEDRRCFFRELRHGTFSFKTKKEPTWQEPRYLRWWDQIGSMHDGDKGDASSEVRYGTFSFHDKKGTNLARDSIF
jgi:hypothetical protein